MKILSFFLGILIVITIGFFTWINFISPIYAIDSSSEKKLTILPTDSFTINFSSPISKATLSSDFKILPKTEVIGSINNDATSITFTPVTHWNPDTKYTISSPSGQLKDFRILNSNTHSFKVISFPEVVQILPQNETIDVILDIEDPISISINKSLEGFDIDFSLTPETPITINNKGLQFHILPTKPLNADTQYTITATIKIKSSKDDKFTKKYSSSFRTLPDKPDAWSKDYSKRLKESKRYTKAKITEGKYIDINLTNQILTTFDNGVIVDNYLISSGKYDMNTPVGTHKIYNKFPKPFSKKYGLYMPNWMAFTSDGSYGLHELPEWPNGYKEGENHLGIPVSHGCVRLGIGSSKAVYDWTEIGIPVIIYYSKI